MKELGRKTGVLVGLDLPWVGGGTEAEAWSPHQGNCLSQRRNTEGWEWNSWLWQPKWNENQTVLATATHIPDRDEGPLEGTAAGSLGSINRSQDEGCCWLQRDGWRGGEGRDCDRKCLWRKARHPWKQGDTAESCIVGGAITIASLSPHTSTTLWTIERLARQTPDTLNYRAGPHPGWSFKWLMCRITE